MISIELRDVRLHAFHGIFEGEEKVGNDYIINVEVKFEENSNDIEDIRDTINYADLYNIIRQRMNIPTGLLEKVCESIVRHIKHHYPFVKAITLSIQKLQAPIEGFEGKVGVTMTKLFND